VAGEEAQGWWQGERHQLIYFIASLSAWIQGFHSRIYESFVCQLLRCMVQNLNKSSKIKPGQSARAP
jgi:hypothetical protein